MTEEWVEDQQEEFESANLVDAWVQAGIVFTLLVSVGITI